jgi:hypothetical protein
MLSDVMLSVIMLSAIMLCGAYAECRKYAIMLSVVVEMSYTQHNDTCSACRGITTLSIITLCILTLSIMTLSIRIKTRRLAQ